jgi:TRAP-type transport system small permease protein
MQNRERVTPLIVLLQKAQVRFAAVALVVMMLATVADVTLRYSLNRPIPGTYDLVECMLVVFVFNGMTATFLQRRNIAIDIIDHFVGRRGIVFLVRLTDIVSIMILGILIWAMITPAFQAYEYGDRKLELALPLYVLWIVAIAGMLGSIIAAIGALISPVTRFTGGDPT